MNAEQKLSGLNYQEWIKLISVFFIFSRFVLLLASPLDGLRGYGDFLHFYSLATLPGWPYIHYWVEFPPIFPFLIAGFARITTQEHVFDYLLFLLLTFCDLINIFLFSRLSARVSGEGKNIPTVFIFAGVLMTLPYCWWYFDSLTVLFLLLSLELLLKDRTFLSGLAVGFGILTKFFPAIVLIAVWFQVDWKKRLISLGAALIVVFTCYGALWAASPEFTRAGLLSQGSKGSWETVWAMLDGNYRTGNFGPVENRLDPNAAYQTQGNAALVHPWISFIIIAGLGLWGLTQVKAKNLQGYLAVMVWVFALLFLWSPGWSPQWVLYLIPLVLLVFPLRKAILMGGALITVNLLEWPVMLSRGYFSTLPLTIGLRTVILILLAILAFQVMTTTKSQPDQSIV
jgi:hypothetical protein